MGARLLPDDGALKGAARRLWSRKVQKGLDTLNATVTKQGHQIEQLRSALERQRRKRRRDVLPKAEWAFFGLPDIQEIKDQLQRRAERSAHEGAHESGRIRVRKALTLKQTGSLILRSPRSRYTSVCSYIGPIGGAQHEKKTICSRDSWGSQVVGGELTRTTSRPLGCFPEETRFSACSPQLSSRYLER